MISQKSIFCIQWTLIIIAILPIRVVHSTGLKETSKVDMGENGNSEAEVITSSPNEEEKVITKEQAVEELTQVLSKPQTFKQWLADATAQTNFRPLKAYTINKVKVIINREKVFKNPEQRIVYYCISKKTGDFQSFKYSGQDDEKDIFLFKEEYKHRKFNFVIHGWSDSFYTTYYVQDIPWTVAVARKWQAIDIDENVVTCVIDWSEFSQIDYFDVREELEKMAAPIVTFIKRIFGHHKVSPDKKVAMISHSMGCVLAAIVCNTMYASLDAPLKTHIFIGIESAGITFEKEKAGKEKHDINKESVNNAMYVHTGTFLGIARAMGHFDYYFKPNGYQPGCWHFICNHLKSLDYIIAALDPKNIFNGIPCGISTYSKKDLKNCAKKKDVHDPAQLSNMMAVLHFPEQAEAARGIYVINDVKMKFPHCSGCPFE